MCLRPDYRAVPARHLEFERSGFSSVAGCGQDFGESLPGERGGRGRQVVLEPLRHGLLDTVATESRHRGADVDRSQVQVVDEDDIRHVLGEQLIPRLAFAQPFVDLPEHPGALVHRCFQGVVVLAKARLGVSAFADERRHRQDRHGHDGNERLHQQQGFIHRLPRKRAEPVHRIPDRDPRREGGRGRGFTWTESKRRPHEPRQRDERQRVVGGPVEQPPPEPDVHADEERKKQQRGLDPLAESPTELRLCAPCDQQRGHEQDAGGVAQPPREPDGLVASRRRDPRQRDRRRADAGAHGAGDERNGRKREDVFRPGKRADQPVKQSPPHDRLQGVAEPDHRGDRDNREDVGRMVADEDHDVRQECSKHDPRPDAIPPQQHGGEGDP